MMIPIIKTNLLRREFSFLRASRTASVAYCARLSSSFLCVRNSDINSVTFRSRLRKFVTASFKGFNSACTVAISISNAENLSMHSRTCCASCAAILVPRTSVLPRRSSGPLLLSAARPDCLLLRRVEQSPCRAYNHRRICFANALLDG